MSEIKLLYCPHYPAIHLVFSPLGRVWRGERYIKIMAKKRDGLALFPTAVFDCLQYAKMEGEGLDLVTCDDNR